MVPLGGGGWAVAHILDISESRVTRVTWGLWHGQDPATSHLEEWPLWCHQLQPQAHGGHLFCP